MLESLYILFSIFALAFSVISFLKTDNIWLHWLTVILTLILVATSGYIETEYCYLTSTDVWSCHTEVYDGAWPLIYFWFGVFSIMFAFAVLMTIYGPWKHIDTVMRKGTDA